MAEHTNNGDMISVEVAYALPSVQTLVSLRLPSGTTALEAVQLSGIACRYHDMDPENVTLGVFGQIVAHGRILRDGDRVEVYRPLTADPKAVRKARAERVNARKKRK